MIGERLRHFEHFSARRNRPGFSHLTYKCDLNLGLPNVIRLCSMLFTELKSQVHFLWKGGSNWVPLGKSL